MDSILKKMYKSQVISSVLLVILGLLLVFKSETTLVTISYVAGSIIIATGVLAFINYFSNRSSSLMIVYGIITVIVGILIISNPEAIASIVPVIIGIGIIINSSIKLQYAIDLKKYNNKNWKMPLIVSLISTVCGVVILFNPFAGAVIITKIIGCFIIIYAISDVIYAYNIKKDFKNIKSAIDQPVYDASVVREKKKKKKD